MNKKLYDKLYAKRNRRRVNLNTRKWDRKVRGSTVETLRKSTVWRGRRAELIAMQLLGAEDSNKEALTQLPYDLVMCGVTINVKSSELVKNHNQEVFHFGKRGKGKSDVYFCIGMTNSIPLKYYWIELENYPKDGVLIYPWGKSKYKKYEVKLGK